jgi:hypothetical protein
MHSTELGVLRQAITTEEGEALRGGEIEPP